MPAGAVPHHSFHVFGVYPWVGLLREGRVDEPLHVLDRCRVRWGQVVEVRGARAVVSSRPLCWDGRRLLLGTARPEEVLLRDDGLGLAGPVQVGDWCSLHWDWVCERLDRRQLSALVRYTADQLGVANSTPSRRLPRSSPDAEVPRRADRTGRTSARRGTSTRQHPVRARSGRGGSAGRRRACRRRGGSGR